MARKLKKPKAKKTKKVKAKKKTKLKKVKRTKVAKKKVTKKVKGAKPLAKVIHYYDRIGVAILALNNTLKVGEIVKFQKGPVEFCQIVHSMQIDHENVSSAKKGAEVGVKVDQPAKEGTLVLPGA